MKKFNYYQPPTLEAAYGLMERFQGEACYVAGGTDVIVRVKQRAVAPEALISLRGIEGLKGIQVNGGLALGSMTLLREMERGPVLLQQYHALGQAVGVLANPQIRNVATVGGNLCNGAPSADCAPPLLVMEAVVRLEGPGGTREVPILDFFTGPGENCMENAEVMTAIRLPEYAPGTGSAFVKEGRVQQDIAITNAAALVVMEGRTCRKCRLSVGAVAPIPVRLTPIEALVEGKEMDPELLEEVARLTQEAVRPITDVRSTEAYRRQISGILVQRALRAAVADARKEKAPTGPVQVQVPIDTAFTDGPRNIPVTDPESGQKKEIHFTLNGYAVSVEVEPHQMLLHLIRDQLGLKGTKEGCSQGECGACTVLVDGMNVDSCLYPAFEAAGKSVTTVEGLLGEGNRLDPLQESFVAHGGVQCGFCTPGMIMSAKALLNENPHPTEADIRKGISGNLCRCTGYVQIVESIQEAAKRK